MRHFKTILLLLTVLTTSAFAQKTAVATMRVSATIISGATLNNIEAINLDLTSNVKTGGSFEFLAPNNMETQVDVENSIKITNEFGEVLDLASDSLHQIENGKHLINLNAALTDNSTNNLRGNYYGNVTTTVNYL